MIRMPGQTRGVEEHIGHILGAGRCAGERVALRRGALFLHCKSGGIRSGRGKKQQGRGDAGDNGSATQPGSQAIDALENMFHELSPLFRNMPTRRDPTMTG